MVQKLRSHAVEQEEEFFYLPKLYVGPDPKPTEPTERVYITGNIQLTGNIIVPNNGTIGQAAGPLLTFDDTNNFLEITGCKVGIGTATPSEKLDITAIGTGAYVAISTFRTSYLSGGFNIRHARGTEASPVILNNGDYAGIFYFKGYDGTRFENMAFFGAKTDGVPAEDDMPGQIFFATTPGGSTVSTVRLTIRSTELLAELPIKIKESATAVADTVAYGQLWVKTATPNTLMFTDDAGTDFTVDVTPV